jgi:hypothetical protein
MRVASIPEDVAEASDAARKQRGSWVASIPERCRGAGRREKAKNSGEHPDLSDVAEASKSREKAKSKLGNILT